MGSLSETLAVITENLKSLSSGLTGRRVFFTTFTFIILIFLTLLATDYFTGYLYFNRIEKKMIVLEKLENKSDDDKFKKNINESYFEILEEIKDYHTRKNISINKNSRSYEIIIKILISLILPFLILLTGIGGPDFKNTFIGVIMFIIFFGILAALIPVIYKLWLTGLIILIIELIVLLILTKIYK